MEIKPKKTVRFTQLIETAGHPVPVTLWTEPEQDRDFSKAIHGNRVLTVIQRTAGAKADYGLVGFFKEPLATYLVFPKGLDFPAQTKVVGLKYDQLAEPKPSGPRHKRTPERLPGVPLRETVTVKHSAQPKPAAPPETKPPKRLAPPPAPKLHTFRANVEIVARQLVPIEVQATSAKEAARLLNEKAAQVPAGFQETSITRKVLKPKKIED